MVKSFWSIVNDVIRRSDVVLEVLDARMPELTRNEKVERFCAIINKPIIFILNKADLIPLKTIMSVRNKFRGKDYIFISSKDFTGISKLIVKIKTNIKQDIINVAVIGYPNTGKSSLINLLTKKGRARTSSESGFTKGVQLIKAKAGLNVFDTPGVIPIDEKDEVKLGLMSSISPDKLKDPDIVAYELIKLFKDNNPKALESAYGIDTDQEPEDIIIEIGKNNNLLLKGGVIDEKRACIKLLRDWHKGKIRL